MGIKLIYYAVQNGTLWFGSEIRAVLAGDAASGPDVDPVALNLFLRYRYTPSPLTIFKGIEKLAPGTMLVVERGEIRRERWYRYTPRPFPSPKTDDEACDELLDLYRAAVRRHLISDVPVGILLSGGLDSALLLALMNDHGGPWPAYTVGYGDTFDDDELTDAAETASLLGADHVPVTLDRAEFETSLPRIVAALEEPIASSSIVPMYFVCQRARQDVKVALIGQGPDELFGGYTRHLGVRYGDLWRRLPRPLRLAISSAVEQASAQRDAQARRCLSGGRRSLEALPARLLARPGRDDRRRCFATACCRTALATACSTTGGSCSHRCRTLDELGGLQLLEIRSSLPDELLMYADKLSMAHGLEVRVPYLDRTIVEYAQRLGSGFKVRGGGRKFLHRRAARRFLPARILRRKKRGFAANVVDGWLHSSLSGKLPELLCDPRSLMFDLLSRDRVRTLLDDHRSRRHDNHKLLFSLALFEQWLRSAAAGRPVAPASAA